MHQSTTGIETEEPGCYGNIWICKDVQNARENERQDVLYVMGVDSENIKATFISIIV